MDTKGKEYFYVTLELIKDEEVTGYHATLMRGQIGREFKNVYETTKSGDAQRAHDCVIAGAGYVDHHGRLFRRAIKADDVVTVEGIEVPCPE